MPQYAKYTIIIIYSSSDKCVLRHHSLKDPANVVRAQWPFVVLNVKLVVEHIFVTYLLALS